MSEGCVLQALTPEVGRADEAIRSQFEQELLEIVKVASDKRDQHRQDKTWVNLAMLIGGVTLARAVADEKVSNDIALAIQNAVNNALS